MIWRLAALLALLLPGAAMADPVSLVAFALNAAVAAKVITLTALQMLAFNVGLAVVGSTLQRRKMRKAAARERAAYNASLQDRSVSVLRADPPWQVIYGRCVVGGSIVDIFGSDKVTRRENGTTYTKADGLKHLVIVLAAHQCEAVHEVYIDGVAVGALDVNGWATVGEFGGSAGTASRSITFTGTATPDEPPLTVLQAYSDPIGDGSNYVPQTVTISGTQLVGPPGVEVTCDYTVATGVLGKVRISKHLGTAGQTTDSYLASVAPSRYTADHRLRGLTYIVVTLDLEEARFQGGPPNITADVSGRLVYDPRTSTTAWSENPALCARDWLTGEWGFSASAGEIDDAYTIAAANACDELITTNLGLPGGGVSVEINKPRYTCNGATTTDQSPEATLEDLAECMAGSVAYGGAWQIMAGTWTSAVLALTDADLHGMIDIVQADTGTDDLFNGLRGQFVASGASSPSDFNPYQNGTFVTADGRELWSNIALPWTNSLPRAKNLCRVFVERNRSGLVIRYPASLKAWPLRVGDRVTVTSTEYGFSAKTFRVTDWQFDAASPVVLTLQEDAADIYDLADAATADPTPNTDLPNPWVVAGMAGLAATSGNATLLRTADGTVLPTVRVTWTARTDAYVVEGGRIELEWRRPGVLAWSSQTLQGSDAEAWIGGVDEGDPLVIRLRAVNTLGARSAWSTIAHTVIGKSAAPSDVTGLAGAVVRNAVRWSWDACTDADYAETELRLGGTGWDDAATPAAFRGRANSCTLPVGAAGTYTARVRHVDESGNLSANTASASVGVAADDVAAPVIGPVDTDDLAADAATAIVDFYDADGVTYSNLA